MSSFWVFHELANLTYFIGQVWMTAHHTVHDAFNFTCIWNFRHCFLLIFTLWWLLCCKIETLTKYIINISGIFHIKSLNRFIRYKPYDKNKSFLPLFLLIFILSILFADPKSFISNSAPNFDLISWIFLLTMQATRMSSTYSNMYVVIDPSSYLI